MNSKTSVIVWTRTSKPGTFFAGCFPTFVTFFSTQGVLFSSLLRHDNNKGFAFTNSSESTTHSHFHSSKGVYDEEDQVSQDKNEH